MKSLRSRQSLPVIFVVACLTVLTACSTFVRDTKRADLLLRLGTSQIEAGDYPSALRSLLEAEKNDSSNPTIQNNLGLVYFFRDRLELAEEHLREAVKLKSDYSDAKNNLARILIEENRSPEALVLLREVLADLTYDRPAKATLNMGLAYFKAHNYVEAQNYFSKTLQYGRDNCLANSFLGRTYFENKDFKRASEALDTAVGFCKAQQFDEPHYYSALAYYQLGDKTKAEARLLEVSRMYSRGKYQEQARSLLETIRK